MSAVVQYSIIILRDDNENVLPGAPVTLTPLVFEPGLEPNEICFTADTGRMFVGHTPSVGQPNFRRTAFPYQNIEVLTENSVGRFNAMVGAYRRAEGDESYYRAELPATSSPQPVTIALPDNPAQEFRLSDATSIAANIEYAAFNSDGKPLRMGNLRILYGTGSAVPVCVDNGTDLDTNVMSLSASVGGPVSGQYVVLNYQYTGTGVMTLRFRVSRPTFTSSM